MSGAVAKLNALNGSLSKAERHVADYVRRNAVRVPFQSVYEVARAAKVSVASVSRMAQQLGYANFKEFKIGLAQEASSPIAAIYAAVKPGDSDEAVIRKVFGGHIRSIQDTLEIVDFRRCSEAARAIGRASRLVFFGIGSSGTIAADAALYFSHLDIQAEAYTDSYHMLLQAIRMRRGQVAVGISHSGRSKITVEALGVARRNGAVTIGISNYSRSPIHKASSIFFCTSFPETGVTAAALSSRTAQICLLDALYLLVARQGKAASSVERVNTLMENLIRLPEKR